MVQLYKADATAGHCSKRFALVTWSVNFKMKEMTSPDTWLVLGKFRRMCRVSFSNPTFPSQPLLKIKACFHWCGLLSVSAFFRTLFPGKTALRRGELYSIFRRTRACTPLICVLFSGCAVNSSIPFRTTKIPPYEPGRYALFWKRRISYPCNQQLLW